LECSQTLKGIFSLSSLSLLSSLVSSAGDCVQGHSPGTGFKLQKIVVRTKDKSLISFAPAVGLSGEDGFVSESSPFFEAVLIDGGSRRREFHEVVTTVGRGGGNSSVFNSAQLSERRGNTKVKTW
jgi:hypothetical protein